MLVLMVFERMKKIRSKWKKRFDETREDLGLPSAPSKYSGPLR